MSIKTAEKLIRAISKERESGHDTLYCTPDVKKQLKRKMSAGIGSSRMVENVEIHGLYVHEIPNPSDGRSVAIVCQEGEVFPLAKDYKQ
jgi:hypothetical protein